MFFFLSRYRNSSKLFQWGDLKCSGFLLLNLDRFRQNNEFWDKVQNIDKEYNLKHVAGTPFIHDQAILQAVDKYYPDMTSSLPNEWDIHISSGAFRWKTTDLVLQNRPQAGMVHLNGGGGSKRSAFESSVFVTSSNYNKTWLVVQYYATYPWTWIKFYLESQVMMKGHQDGKVEKGYPIIINYKV